MRQVNMEVVETLNAKYDVDVDLFAKLGTNFKVGGVSNNLGACYVDNKETPKCVTEHNEYDKVRTFNHQLGGKGIAVRDAMTQYFKSISKDKRGLGRYCFCIF